MPRIRVTGYLDIEESEYDDGPNGPLTEEAFMEYTYDLSILDDIEFDEVKD